MRTVSAGERIVIPPNTPHYFWNEGPDEARAIQELRPALQTEQFFRTYFALARDRKTDETGMPMFLQLVTLVPAFADEIRPTRPPWPVLRLLALILAPIARWRGLSRRLSIASRSTKGPDKYVSKNLWLSLHELP